MRYFIFLFIFWSTTSIADTETNVVFDCDTVRNNDLACVSCNIYHEARGEPLAGQVAVALVTKNRVQSKLYPDDYCAVVWEQRRDRRTKKNVAMFSWTYDGKHDKVYNEQRWAIAVSIADRIINDTVHDMTVGALWYHAISVDPYWSEHYYPTVRVGNHQFYTSKEEVYLDTLVEGVFSDVASKLLVLNAGTL